ncbi:MAG: dihydropteroate synthase [Bacteroidales bacterium]|nr:dihydropteroate synthase [Bacteroidales bacterium]
MGIINATPDSFAPESRYNYSLLDDKPDIVDLGAVSSRPGAADVSEAEEWRRLEAALDVIHGRCPLSVDTFRSGIVRRVHAREGRFIVNDIYAGRQDEAMLDTVAELGLGYIAMHMRGTPGTMDSLCDYGAGGIMEELKNFFGEFSLKATRSGISDWILDPGLGFAKTTEQNFEILERLEELRVFGRPILIGAADKRFTGGKTEEVHLLALRHGADILRVHNVPAARATIEAAAALTY